jgi:hypothetical protein
MIEKYIQTLINNLPKKIIQNTQNINLVLDGGIFNGSYLMGCIFFLKEMENRNYIKIHKISCCSVSCILALIYHLDANKSFNIIIEMYKKIIIEFKQNKLINIDSIIDFIKHNVVFPKKYYKKLNKKLYISYYNVNTCRQIIKSKYKNMDDLYDTIKKSCFVPFLIDGNINYKNKYIDGINPFIFPFDSTKKTLYINLLHHDKISHMINIKNETTNIHRILYGLLDIHTFFIKENNTNMCSYIDSRYMYLSPMYIIKKLIEKIIIYTIYYTLLLKNKYSCLFGNLYDKNIIKKRINDIFNIIETIDDSTLKSIIYKIYCYIIDNYCV